MGKNENEAERTMIMKHKAIGVHRIILIIFTALCLFGSILTMSVKFIFAAIIIGIISVTGLQKDKKAPSEKKDIILRVISVWIVLMFIFSTPPLGLSSRFLWQYPFQKSLVGMYSNVKEPEWFPDFREDVLGEYRFDYLPSIMQGTGHFSVRFRTSPRRAAEYAEIYSRQAKWTIAFDNAIYSEPRDECPDFFSDRDFWGDSSAKVYILDGVADWNHPHSSAVIIDTNTGKIQLSQLG